MLEIANNIFSLLGLLLFFHGDLLSELLLHFLEES